MFQEKLIHLGNGSCLYDCYCYFGGIQRDSLKLSLLGTAIEKGIVGWDGFVKDGERLFHEVFAMVHATIKRTTEKPLSDEVVIAEWSFNGTSHFVVMQGNTVIYDPLGNSNTVENGKIVSYRIVHTY